jgi:hypothetical protein
MIIGDAHDQPALALHQILHARLAPLIPDIVITRLVRNCAQERVIQYYQALR